MAARVRMPEGIAAPDVFDCRRASQELQSERLGRECAMNRAGRILVAVLRIVGAAALLAIVPVVMPHAWMDSIHGQIGLGELPHQPIIGYLTRSLSEPV